MAKLLGMLRYEMIMGWRRGSSRMILIVSMLMPIVGFLLFTSPTLDEQRLAASQMTQAVADRLNLSMALSDNVFLVPILMLLVPMLVAENIPLDRQYRMYEIVRALPLGAGTYLAGKVLSAVIPVLGAVGAAAAISLIIQMIRGGSVDYGIVARFWLGGIVVLALFAAISGVLMAATQPTRRRAILLGGVAAALSVVVYLILPINEMLLTSMVETYALSTTPSLSPDSLPAYPALFSGQYLMRYQYIAAGVALIWGFMVWRLRNSEAVR
jgi:hypothetical protein